MIKKGIIEKDIVVHRDIKNKLIITLIIVFIIFNIINLYMIVTTFYFKKITGYGSDTASISLVIEEWRVVEINSPLNQSYNYSSSGSYPINLNVSSNFNNEIHAWWFTLVDLTNNITLNDSEIFTPNITIYPARYSNQLTVFANRTGNYTYNASVVFFINAKNSAPTIENLSLNNFACEGSFFSELFNASDVDNDPISSSLFPQFPNNPFFIQYLYNVSNNLSTHEIFSGTLSKQDAGGIFIGSKLYKVNVSITDNFNASCCSDTEQFNITIIEINNIPVIENIGTKTIWSRGDNNTLYIQTNVNDVESGDSDDGNMSFNITIKNSTGNNVSLFNISSIGVINFTANSSNLGVYNVTICVSDQSLLNPHTNISLCSNNGDNQSDCEVFSLTITAQNRAPQIISQYPNFSNFTANEGDASFLNITSRDPDTTIADTYWYVDGVFKKYQETSNVSEFSFSWEFSDAGFHNITVVITDGELNDSFVWNVTIIDVEVVVSVGGGGGGGGGVVGIPKVICTPKWGCSDWNECQNLTILQEVYFSTIFELCRKYSINKNFCGFQTRECSDINKCDTILNKPDITRQCHYTPIPNCNDGIKNCHNNACEVLVDCGGPCKACPSCDDGIKNQGEENIDCGGPCNVCVEHPLVKIVRRGYFFYLIALVLFIIAIILFIRFEIKRYRIKKMIQERKEKMFS